MEPDARKLSHTKGKRSTVGVGPPKVSDMNEGEPYIRYIPGPGVVVFYMYSGKIYHTQLTEGLP